VKTLLLALLLSLPSYAGAQVLATIPVSIDGTPENFGPVTLPQLATFARVVFDSKDKLSGDQTITVVLRRSVNGGMTFEPAGGDVFHAGKQPADFAVPLSQVGNPDRVLEGRVTLYGARWRGRVFIEIE
jgi:hypothetical protein